ncbi:MAG: AAA family ATPase [Chthoniobacteraceae bacterium]|nr:AAA family ATPase [Chthoniobacteraceae bacterium]
MQSAATPKPSLTDLWAKAQVMGKRYAATLRKYWWVPALTVGLGLGISFWKSVNRAPSYVSNARMILSGQFQIEGTARVTESGDFLGTQFDLIRGDIVAMRARNKLRTMHPEWIPVPVSVEISRTPATAFLSLRATGEEPVYTQAFLDAVMQEYMALRRELRVEKSDNMTSAIHNQLILTEKQEDSHEREMLSFQEKNNSGFLQAQGNSAGEYLSSLELELAKLKTELNLLNTLKLDQIIDRVQMTAQQQQQQQLLSGTAAVSGTSGRSLSTLDPMLNNNNAGPMMDYQRANQNLQLLKAKREEYLKTMKPKNPKVTDLEEQIAQAENLKENYRLQSVEYLRMRKESFEYQIKSKEAVIQEWNIKAMDLSQKLAENDRLRLKLEHDRKQYDQLIATLQSVEVYKNVEQESISVLENATPAMLFKVSLLKTLFGGFATGLLAGMAILFLVDKTDDRIGALIECQGHFREYPIMGQIPHEAMDGDLALLVPYDPRRELLEAFRALRSSILFAPVEGTRPKALMVTSAAPGEGKTALAANLAATLAFSGAKTLLVDCDMNGGRLHEFFGATPDKGFLNVLQQQIPWNEAVVQTAIDNLYLLPRGEALAYPAEHFFGAFLKDVYAEFDYLIFDSASVLDNVDALSFAPIVDGVLFTVRLGQTSAGKAMRALAALNARQVNVLGLVCNDVGALAS